MAEQISIVEIGEAIQEEIINRMLAFIKDHRKQNRAWATFKRWVGSIKRCRCVCGTTGVGCECERPPPPQLIPKMVKLHSLSDGQVRIDKADTHTKRGEDGVVTTMI
jgi:hypothetical protein